MKGEVQTSSSEDRERLYIARRIIRASAKPKGRTYRKLILKADSRTLRMVELLPIYLERFCIARAEKEVVRIVDSETGHD